MADTERPRWWPWSASRGRGAPSRAHGRMEAAEAPPAVGAPEPVSDPAWAAWGRAREGDEAAARALVTQLAPPALALARQLLGRHEEAQDVVQEAFLRLWTSRLRDRGDARLSTCFHTIVINRCRSRLSARRETPFDPEDLAPLHEAHAAEAGGAGLPPLDTHGLHEALATLPVRQRMALVMWAWADADAAAIGEWLGIEANAAHQLLHRARRKLRERLGAADGDVHDDRP